MGDLEVVLSIPSGMGTDEKAMSRVGLVGNTVRERSVGNVQSGRLADAWSLELLTLAHQVTTEWSESATQELY